MKDNIYNLLYFSAFGEYFTVGTHASMVTGIQVFRVTWEENHLAVNIVITLSGLMYSEVCAVALSNNKVCITSYSYYYYKGLLLWFIYIILILKNPKTFNKPRNY